MVMNSQPPSSAPIPPTFQKNGMPAHYLEWLEANHTKIHTLYEPIREDGHNAWLQTVSGLVPFVYIHAPEKAQWKSLHELIRYCEKSLPIVYHASKRVPSLFNGHEKLGQALFVLLVLLATTLDRWIEEDPVPEEGYSSPTELYDWASAAASEVLRSLGEEAVQSSRQLMLNVNDICFNVVNDLVWPSEPVEYPKRLQIADPETLEYLQKLDNDFKIFDIMVNGPNQVPLVASCLLDICLKSLSPSVTNHWLTAAFARDKCQTVQKIRDHFFFSDVTAGTARFRALARVSTALSSFAIAAGFPEVAEAHWSRLLLYRLENGPDLSWEPIELGLTTSLRSSGLTPRNHADFLAIVRALHAEDWADEGNSLRTLCEAYITLFVPSLDRETLRYASGLLNPEEIQATYRTFLNAVVTRIQALEHPDSMALSAPSWRFTSYQAVNNIIGPRDLNWMDDGDSFTDTEFISRCLNEIDSRFEQEPPWSTTSEGLETLAKKLAEFPCLLFHANDKCTPESNADKPDICFAAVYMKVAFRILDCDSEKIRPRVHVAVYNALARSLRHHTSNIEERLFEDLISFIGRGMKDKERGVRLAAGRSLADLVKLVQRFDGASEYTSIAFQKLFPLLKNATNPVRETTLVTVGLLGKTSPGFPLRESVCTLVFQMGQYNPVLKGTAILQLHGLARHYDKSPYNLAMPYQDVIAPYLVRRLHSEPYGIAEFCEFVSMGVSNFVVMTYKHSLPRLFADGDIKLLEAVANVNGDGQTVGLLVLDQAHYILSHAFMLQGIGQTHKTLTFITNVLKSQSQDPSALNTASIVFSSLLPTLTEIVAYLGDEDVDVMEAAKHGLKKIAKVFENSDTASQNANIETMLRDNMLGIVTNLNDMLQNHGKLPIETKQRILRSFGEFSKLVGPTVSNIAPQVMATLQTMLLVPQLCDAALSSWYLFIAALNPVDIGPHVGPTSASFVAHWSTFSDRGRRAAKECINFMVVTRGSQLGDELADVADLSSIPELREANHALTMLRAEWSLQRRLTAILHRLDSENHTVAVQSAIELRKLLQEDGEQFIRSLTTGDAFDYLAGDLVAALYRAACRDVDGAETLHGLVFECIGIVGAIDPDRFEVPAQDSRMLVLRNFGDENEAAAFALHIIKTVLVSAYRTTRDIKYQTYLGFTIQELLRFCKLTPALIKPGSQPLSLKVRNRWNSLPKGVLETVTPLLESRFSAPFPQPLPVTYPIYPSHSTYRQWVQAWTSDLINKASGHYAPQIFRIFAPVVRNKDVGVAHHLLPYLVLNVIASGDENAQLIRSELLAVLEDQVDPNSHSTPDKKLLSAQTVFMLFDHLNLWIRTTRQDLLNQKETDSKRSSRNSTSSASLARSAEQLVRVDSILSNIDHSLMEKAASQCKAYARALMNLEYQIRMQRDDDASVDDLQRHYERLHELYALLEEPDGMEGVSPLILSPSLEHQIREHESTGRWTSAQSCWEVRLQHDPDNLEYHLGLLRCLRNLGHYDSLRTHVKGVLTRNPEWGPQLVGFQIESEWMVGHWDEVQRLVDHTEAYPSQILIAQVLLAMRSGDPTTIASSLSQARLTLGSAITASGTTGYGRSYDAVLDLHLVHELELINRIVSGQANERDLAQLPSRLAARFESTLPSFRIREPILNMRRTALKLSTSRKVMVDEAVGKLWLNSAKIARKAGHTQTAYSALLQAQQSDAPFSFIESARLSRISDEPMRALQELDKSIQVASLFKEKKSKIPSIEVTVNHTGEQIKAKAHMLLARWMAVSNRWEDGKVDKAMKVALKMWPDWESGHFHLGQFADECFKALTSEDKAPKERGAKLNMQTVQYFTKSIALGSKYTYQTLPRVLTIWLDMSEDVAHDKAVFNQINVAMDEAIKTSPAYKWYTAFPQIVSRIGVRNEKAFNILAKLISTIIFEYPQQALWLFTAVRHGNSHGDTLRKKRAKNIMTHIHSRQSRGVNNTIKAMTSMAEELIRLCHHVPASKGISIKHTFPDLRKIVQNANILIPLQESLTASLPPSSVDDSTHQPFPVNPPTFVDFYEEITILMSMAKPKKLTVHGSNGTTYALVAKKDDLRKDGRLMDFDAILNKLLMADSESRRRQLKIRTYGVVSLTEECGMIQWVPNTIPIRSILEQHYSRRGWAEWFKKQEFTGPVNRIKASANATEATEIFIKELLPLFPSVLHEWFVETFSEPALWLASRKAFSRSAAVMSMVGYILGLGDRHLENILLDTITGDVVHVDFDCLFERGQLLETPEIVPFRLTHNIVDGFGVTGVEGVYRISCEVTLRLLRENKDCLKNVLDAFVHDPLLEWIEKRHRDRSKANNNPMSTLSDVKAVSLRALEPIEQKLEGKYRPCKTKIPPRYMSVINHVQALISEATDPMNLSRMYPGWAPFT